MISQGWLLKTVVFAILGAILVPLLAVIGVSFNPTSRFVLATTAISLRCYAEFWSRREFIDALFLVSLPLAIVSAMLATVTGTLAAIALVRFRMRGRDFLETTFMIPILIPSILLGLALYLFSARLGLAGRFGTLVVGHMLIGIPFVVRVVVAALVGVNPALEEAAISLGCTRVQAFRKVVIPLLRSSVLSGAIFAFILSFSDVNVALFVSGPTTNTMPLEIFSEIQWQGDPTIAAASTVQIVVVTLLILAAQRLTRARITF